MFSKNVYVGMHSKHELESNVCMLCFKNTHHPLRQLLFDNLKVQHGLNVTCKRVNKKGMPFDMF